MKQKLQPSHLMLIIIALLFASNIPAQDNSVKESDLADQIIQIKGSLRTYNEKKEAIAVISGYIVFQRLDCKKCLVATRSKSNGEYEILVSRGKYKVFVFEFGENQRLYDVVSPNQNRIVNAQDKIRGNLFDIEIIYKSEINLPEIELESNKSQVVYDLTQLWPIPDV